ncbi:complement factor I-like [Pararge aegeria]|uniref:complement factor I-like n=1 Tax=Pararge aegeria TaxID=116150 RepID=UPI0019D1FF8C|nr:complement factor I-like [Pararge aegeria]
MAAVMHLVVTISLVTTAIYGARIKRLNLTPYKVGGPVACISKNNKSGLCVHESVCNEEHTIMPGGVLDLDIDYREKKQCPAQSDWCCTSDVIPHPQIGVVKSDNCLPLKTDVCPWCVLLYNVVGVQPTSTRPFCLGALIGSKVIITASTCLLAAQKKMLYAQVPNSADPGKNYTVIRRQFHPNYNTGTHEHDFGILVMESDAAFIEGKARGTCIDFQVPLEGDCVGYGFDNEGQITSTFLKVTKNSCGKNGSSKDAACGLSTEEVCIVAGGGPVLCQRKNEGSYLVGVARSACNSNNEVILGGISHSKEWIENELGLMDVPNDVYT